MKSIKPGRGPSAMGAFGGIIVAIFGIFWTVFAAGIGAPPIFPLFGVLFIIFAIVGVVYNYKNATGSNRMSVYDITEEEEEPDPLNIKYHNSEKPANLNSSDNNNSLNYCPYCRFELKESFRFCPSCGNDLSELK